MRVVAVGVLSALAGLILIGSAVAVLALPSSVNPAEAQSSLRDAGCTVRSFPATSAFHLDDFRKAVKYNSFPPSNGDHYQWPAVWGFYPEPVDPRRLVHNLEHGGLAIQYGTKLSDESLDRLFAFYARDRNAVVLAPLPALGRRIALTAWIVDPEGVVTKGRKGAGYVALCPRIEEDAFGDFRAAFRYRGPESYKYRPEFLEPGG